MGHLLQLGRQLIAWTMWADRQHLAAVAGLPEEHLTLDTGTSFGSLLGTFAHLLGAERMWLSRFVGTPLAAVPGLADYPSLPALQTGFEELWPDLEFFLASLTEDQLTTPITWSNTSGESFTRPLCEPLTHMASHSAYHRGQLTTLTRQLGHQPPKTDLIHYLVSRQPPAAATAG